MHTVDTAVRTIRAHLDRDAPDAVGLAISAGGRIVTYLHDTAPEQLREASTLDEATRAAVAWLAEHRDEARQRGYRRGHEVLVDIPIGGGDGLVEVGKDDIAAAMSLAVARWADPDAPAAGIIHGMSTAAVIGLLRDRDRRWHGVATSELRLRTLSPDEGRTAAMELGWTSWYGEEGTDA